MVIDLFGFHLSAVSARRWAAQARTRHNVRVWSGELIFLNIFLTVLG